MVYCGRPSKACARCRLRRLKCDFSRPQCHKCLAAHVVCSGYRDEQDLLFRDQTHQVVSKHSTQERTPSPNDRSRATVIRCLDLIKEPVVENGKMVVDPGTLEVAVTFLLRCYFRGSSFEWVGGLYGDNSRTSMFTDMVKATAIAAYSHECRRIRLLTQARMMYNNALLQVRKAIEQGEPATNSVWASVLLMSRFESLLDDGNANSIFDSWLNHVSGAFAIMQAREKQGTFEDPLSCALREQTIHNYNLYCVRTSTSRPPSLITATNELLQTVQDHQDNAQWELRLTFHQLSEVLGEFRRFEQTASISEHSKVMRWARILDEQAMQYQNRLSAVANYDKLPISRLRSKKTSFDIDPYPDIYHMYRNHHGARKWNSLRLLRIYLHESVCLNIVKVQRHQTSTGLSFDGLDHQELERVLASSLSLIQRLAKEICASAPQFLQAGTPDCTHAAASFLAWPLFVAGRCFQGRYKEFVRASLRWMDHELNIKSAGIAADHLDSEDYKDGHLFACFML